MDTLSTIQPRLMKQWADFPATYRREQVATILRWVALGESGVVVGASGTGKSNIIGYLANRPDITSQLLPEEPAHYCFLHFDINSLPAVTTTNFYRGMLFTLQDATDNLPDLRSALTQLIQQHPTSDDHLALYFTLQKAHELIIRRAGKHVVWLIDRFDEACKHLEAGVLNSLRNLRDRFKEQISYIVFSRFPLARVRAPREFDEFHGIMTFNTCWVGPMKSDDAETLAFQIMKRHRTAQAATDIQLLIEMTGGWPALLKVGVSALATSKISAGASLDAWQQDLLQLTGTQRNCEEIWDDCSPAEQAVLAAIAWRFAAADLDPAMLLYLQQLGLLQKNGVDEVQIFAPLFEAFIKQRWRFTGPISLRNGMVWIGPNPLPVDLTLLELRLLEYLITHAGVNCEKNDLIAHIWPDEKQVKGIRDDSLVQLVKRLRRKIEPVDKSWTYIENIHGRGYKLNQPGQ